MTENPYSAPELDTPQFQSARIKSLRKHFATWMGFALIVSALFLPCVGFAEPSNGLNCVFVMTSYFVAFLFTEKYALDEYPILVGVFLISIPFSLAAVALRNDDFSLRPALFSVVALFFSFTALWLAEDLNVGYWVYVIGLLSIMIGQVVSFKTSDA